MQLARACLKHRAHCARLADWNSFCTAYRGLVEGFQKRFPALQVDIDAELAKYKVGLAED